MIRIAGYLMDLAVSEEHAFPSEISSHPVEQGPDISDHIRNLPEEITLESIVSDTPIGEVAADPSRQAAGPDAPLPSADAFQKLVEIRAARQPVTVETSLGTFENMGLENLDVPKDAAKAGGLFFTARFKRMNLVQNKRTRRRVATPMAGAGGKATPKAKALTPIEIDRVLDWRQGVPPGGPLPPGYKIVRVIQGRRTRPTGFTREELQAIGATDFDATAPSPGAVAKGRMGRTELVHYYYRDTEKEIRDDERRALIADLRRDAAERREAQLKDLQRSLREDPAGTFKKMQNLPAGVPDLGAFTRPPPPTLP